MSQPSGFNLEKWRFPIAMVLSFAIILGWVWFTQKNAPAQKPTPAAAPLAAGVSNLTASVSAVSPMAPVAVMAAPAEKAIPAKLAVLENDDLRITLSSRGGVVVSNLYKKSPKGSFVDFEEGSLSNHHCGSLIFGNKLDQAPLEQAFELSESSPRHQVWRARIEQAGAAYDLVKRYDLNSNDLKLTLRMEHRVGPGLQGSLMLLNGSSIGPSLPADKRTSFDVLTAARVTGNSYNVALAPGMFSSASKYETHPATEWIALHSRYYFKALRPDQGGAVAHFLAKHDSVTNLPVGGYEVPFTLAAGGVYESHFTYSFLPKNRELLNTLSDATGIQWYQIFDQYSFMRILASAMYYPMTFINGFVKNYGITILILTLFLKMITWPLNQKSLVTMQKMQSLKPKIDEIQKSYKGDAQKINQATMALYQKEKVNPLSGCLPMLIPMPVFFALYSLFRSMIEMDLQSFLWIKDLSLPDMAFLLPFEIPFIGHYVNLLPIIMTLTQVLQSVRTPQPDASANSTQTFIFKYIFPFMFLFILWSMPSALVLFWTLQNIVSWLQAEWVRSRKNRAVAAPSR